MLHVTCCYSGSLLHVDDADAANLSEASDSEDEFTRRANRMVSRQLGVASDNKSLVTLHEQKHMLFHYRIWILNLWLGIIIIVIMIIIKLYHYHCCFFHLTFLRQSSKKRHYEFIIARDGELSSSPKFDCDKKHVVMKLPSWQFCW